jgi:uncharacterized protein GlcG (DUF336 family)
MTSDAVTVTPSPPPSRTLVPDGTVWKAGIGFALVSVIAQHAIAKAEEIGVPSVIAIVDESGVDKFLARMDGAGLASVRVAQNKAYTALSTGMPTHQIFGISQQLPELGYGLQGVPRLCAIAGGLPIRADGVTLGALGISGGTLDEDMLVARHALAAAGVPFAD